MVQLDPALQTPQNSGLAVPLKITSTQQAVLDQLHNHVAFSESLILLTGPQGAGKSSILEIFLEQASDYANLAYLPAPDKQKTDLLRRKILRQLVSLDAYAADDTLLEALQRNLKPGRQHLVITIDNGSGLPADLLSELQELVSSRHLFRPEHQISVILAGLPAWAKRVNKGVSLSEGEAPVSIDVPPFSKREQAWFGRALVSAYEESTGKVPNDEFQSVVSDHRLRDLLLASSGYPGDIQKTLQRLLMPANEQPQDDDDTPAMQPPHPAFNVLARLAEPKIALGLIGAAAVMSLLLALWPNAEPASPQPASLDEELTTPTAETVIEHDDASEEAAAVEATLPIDDEESAVDEVTHDDESPLAMDFEQALARLNEAARENPDTRDIRFQLIQPLDYLEENPLSTAEAEPDTEPTAPETPTNPWLESFDNAQFAAAEPSDYVLQVAAFNSEDRLMQFLAGFSHDELSIYHTLRNDEDWYMVTVGQFSSAEQARAFLAEQEDLQALQPWVKSMAAVHDDLASVLDLDAEQTP